MAYDKQGIPLELIIKFFNNFFVLTVSKIPRNGKLYKLSRVGFCRAFSVVKDPTHL